MKDNPPFVDGPMAAGPHLIVAWLRTGRYRVSTESALQQDMRDRIAELRCRAWREYRLAPGDRVDFFVEGGVAIEAKTKCSARKIYRQLERYAGSAEVSAIILVTGTAMGLPETILGKPAFYVGLGRTAL